MQSTLIITVLIIKFIYCAHIGFSEEDQLQNVENNKPRSEIFEKFIGNPKKFHKTSIKELVGAKYKKRCDTCRDTIRCKVQGKCDMCTRYCKDVDTTTLPPPTSAPLVGSIQVYLEDETPVTEQTPFEKCGRYYTLGAFGPGPKQNLIARLMHVAKQKSLEKLVVLAKPTGKFEEENPEHPIIIDTANAFQSEDNNKKIFPAIHSLNGNAIQQAIDLDLTSKIDQELDMAMAEKQKIYGKSYLTNKEVDKIIDKVLSTVSSSPQPNLVELGSRFNIISSPHITTKRSVSNWPLNKNREDTPEDKQALKPILRSNKRTVSKPVEQENFLQENVGSPQEDSQRDTYLAEDDYPEDRRLENPDSSEIGQDLLEYEPAPPTNRETGQNYSSPAPPPIEKSDVLDVPVSNNHKLESASQHLEEKIVGGKPVEDDPEPAEEHDNPNELDNEEDVIVTLTQAPETYDENDTLTHGTNDSDPIVGSNWFADELEEAKHWWHANVGMNAPSNLTNQIQDKLHAAESKINLLNASHFTVILKNLEQKVENIADLVKKTCGGKENPKDETVGKEAPTFTKLYEEENPVPIKSNPQPALESRNTIQVVDASENDTKDFENITAEPPRESQPHLLDTAMKDLNEGADYLINKAVNIVDRLQNVPSGPKRTEIKPILQAPERPIVGAANSDRKIITTDVVGCKEDSDEYLGEARIDKDNKEDPKVACSKEDSEEYLGEKLKTNNDKLPSRSALESDPAIEASPKDSDPIKTLNNQAEKENVACSKESDEYVGKSEEKDEPKSKTNQDLFPKLVRSDIKKIIQDDPSNSPSTTQEVIKISPKDEKVACSKEESEEYVGEQKERNLDEVPSEKEEAVGCSKEEDEEYVVPVYKPYGYNPYRESDSNPKSNSPDLPKHKIPHLPKLDNLLHRNHLPQRVRDGSLLHPLKKHSKLLPQPSRELNHNQDVPAPAHQSNTAEIFDNPEDNQKFEPANPDFAQSQKINSNRDPVETLNEEIRNLPALRAHQNKMLSPPALNQRFGEDEDGIHAHRPKTLQDWPQPAPRDEVLGAKKDLETTKELSEMANTRNPFTIFGKVVPQLNNTEVSFHQVPNDKIYFLGTGMQLPLNMKKDEDGTYQLSVDIDKLCSNCKGNSCDKKEELGKKDEAGNNERVGMQPPPEETDEIIVNETTESNTNQGASEIPTHSKFRTQDDKNVDSKQILTPHRIKILSMDDPSPVISKRINKGEAQQHPQLFEQGPKIKRKLKHQKLFDRYSNNERKHFKRSVETIFPSLMNNEKNMDLDGHKNEAPQKNSLQIDASLKKIDDDMKRYFDRRQKLDEFYKNQVRRDLERPSEEKDIVKRRVKLVNNVISWMKSIAVQSPSSSP